MKICKDVAQLNRHLERCSDKKIVFTNGVFDIIHPGHIDLLEFARQCGDLLILAINDDASVRCLGKGESRPFFPLAERMEILEAVQYVDFIIPFPEPTPLELIKSIYRIDVLVKGGDYSLAEVVGREEVEKAGGKVLLFQFRSNYSTTAIIKKIK